MNFHTLYRASFYAMLFFATLVLSVDATDLNRLAMLYPVAVAVAGAVAFFTVDREPRLAIASGTATILGLGSLGLVYIEYRYDENLLLLALAHWLVYLQLITIFRPKGNRDDWRLFGIGLMQVLVGGVMSQSDVVGLALFAWGLSAIWVLALFSLSREAERGRPAPGTTVFPSFDHREPYPGLIDAPFVLASLRVALTTLALGGLIFLVMPRRNTMGSSIKGDAIGKHLTGFDDEVQLGQLGEILENDSMVMTIELTDHATGKLYDPAGKDLYWRGVAMARYERGRWKRQPHNQPVGFGAAPLILPGNNRLIRQQIKLEPTDNPVLFGLRPLIWAAALGSNRIRFSPESNAVDGSITRSDARPVSIDYQVLSADDVGDSRQPREQYPGLRDMGDLLSITAELKALLRPLAEKACQGIDPADRRKRARAIERWLRDSGEFHYSLSMDIVDPKLDPVADFLLNRKEGHCEYYASAMTLLLRSIDIPARLVNGFKGGDWNNLAGVMNVRQKHAHSWAEALMADAPVPGRPGDPPLWIRLDPTPGIERDRSVARVGGVSVGFRQFFDFVRYVWVFYVVGFNFERQQKFLYEPIRGLVQEAMRGFQMIGQALKLAFDRLFHFQDLSSFISIRGFLVTFFALSFLVLVGRAIRLLIRRHGGSLRGRRRDEAGMAVGVLSYRRLVALLAGLGLERPPAETPREFARRAAGFLAGHASTTESVADVPPLVVEAYYRIRFGQVEPDPDQILQVERRLDALEARLRPAST